jgi:hypothetical protein
MRPPGAKDLNPRSLDTRECQRQTAMRPSLRTALAKPLTLAVTPL